jgi:hypothetical protein
MRARRLATEQVSADLARCLLYRGSDGRWPRAAGNRYRWPGLAIDRGLRWLQEVATKSRHAAGMPLSLCSLRSPKSYPNLPRDRRPFGTQASRRAARFRTRDRRRGRRCPRVGCCVSKVASMPPPVSRSWWPENRASCRRTASSCRSSTVRRAPSPMAASRSVEPTTPRRSRRCPSLHRRPLLVSSDGSLGAGGWC